MFADQLKDLRAKRKLSQMKLSELLGVAQQTVASWETNKSSPSYDLLKTIATMFQVTTDYLLEMPQSSIETDNLTADERDLIDGYRSLDEWGRSSIHSNLHHELQRCAALPDAKKKRLAM